MDRELRFEVGDAVYYAPHRKNKGLLRARQRAVVFKANHPSYTVRLHSGLLKYVKIESLAVVETTKHDANSRV